MCQLVPGHGVAVGDVLVDDPRVHVIAFTGSREIGQRILERAARFSPGQEHVKRVVCEMGGKNAIIVDDDADLDEVVRETVHSAFGYQGQKCSACSRLIAVGGIHDRLLARLTAALDAWPYGPPEDPQYVFGPLITEAAQAKTLEYIEIGKSEGRLVYQGRVPETGYYVAPAIFAGIRPEHRIAQEEIFGPVLAVMHAETFAQAIDIALDSRYALTGGVFSRLPEHLELAREQFHVGNLYSQPAHHRGARRGATVRRVPALGHRHPGGRRGLSEAVHVVARRHREHDPAWVCPLTAARFLRAQAPEQRLGVRTEGNQWFPSVTSLPLALCRMQKAETLPTVGTPAGTRVERNP